MQPILFAKLYKAASLTGGSAGTIMEREHRLLSKGTKSGKGTGGGGVSGSKWLKKNKPKQELVFSHGDLCLPYIFLKDGRVSSFIDLGDSGIGDKWRDIALCYRSLKHNFDGTYGGRAVEDFNPNWLFEVIGLKPDWEKLRYYILLDELF